MKINRLKLINFRQHAKTEIAFDGGITGIIGPNGSGKTTILEAIAWALYGNQAVRGTRDSIRHTGAGARAEVKVELDFELAGHTYRIVRGLTTAAAYLDGADSAIANSISGVNDLLQRRLGMSRTEFFNTYFTGQKELSIMSAMGPTERAQFLSRVLGYERLRTAQDLLREKRRLIGAEIAGLRSGMPDPETIAKAVKDAESRVATAVTASNEAGAKHAQALGDVRLATPAWEGVQKQREQWQRLLADVTIAEREAATLDRDHERVSREIEETAAAREELQTLTVALQPLRDHAAELQLLDELFRQQGRRTTLIESERALTKELTQLRERLVKLETAPALEVQLSSTLERQRADLQAAEKELELKRTSWVRDKQEAETKLQELRRQYSDVKTQRERVVTLGADGVCPTCNRKLGDTFKAVVDALGEQLQTLQIDGQYYRDRGAQLEKPPADLATLDEKRRTLAQEVTQLERRLTQVQVTVQELPILTADIAAKDERRAEIVQRIAEIPDHYDAARHATLRAEIERLTPLSNRAARLSASVERVPALMTDQDRIVRERTSVQERLAGLKAQGATTQFSERDYTHARDLFERATASARSTELAVVAAQHEVRNAQHGLDAALSGQREFARVAEKLAELNRGRLLHDELDRSYSDLRTDLNFQLRPELSDLASTFLRDLTDGRYSQLELDDQYNVLILEDDIAKPVISGGEEDLASLVLRLAISQMIAERAGQAFSLLILDEVFGSLDASRRDNVIELLRKLQDRFEQVILITHIEGVRDGVDRVLTVRYDQEAGTSMVETGDEGFAMAGSEFEDDVSGGVADGIVEVA